MGQPRQRPQRLASARQTYTDTVSPYYDETLQQGDGPGAKPTAMVTTARAVRRAAQLGRRAAYSGPDSMEVYNDLVVAGTAGCQTMPPRPRSR
ncbi:hypothetical protein ACFT4A_31440 [Streptomyces sp. NPDC057099]|uniref:hypothetical protein n=1 Tax=Streptomyces sp. NPDC057099 TaxID=3346019 RepID=UPI003630B93B